MPASTGETILEALQAALGHFLPSGAVLPRNHALPAEIPASGVVILRDGDPGEPEITLSPLTYHYEHRAEIDVLVDLPGAAADAAFDALRIGIGMAIADDRTLGGLCDWIEARPPAPSALVTDGAEPIKAGIITVVLHYASEDSLA